MHRGPEKRHDRGRLARGECPKKVRELAHVLEDPDGVHAMCKQLRKKMARELPDGLHLRVVLGKRTPPEIAMSAGTDGDPEVACRAGNTEVCNTWNVVKQSADVSVGRCGTIYRHALVSMHTEPGRKTKPKEERHETTESSNQMHQCRL